MIVKTAASAQVGLRKATTMVGQAAQSIAALNTNEPHGASSPLAPAQSVNPRRSFFLDPTKAVIAMKSGQIMYRANLEVIKVTDEMRGKAADLIA